ncbi:MAG: MFS transporter, partial [Acidimicrobiia bacterium]
MSEPRTPPTLRSLGPGVYLPSFIFAVGQGAVIPIVALVAKDLGASVAVAGLVVAGRGLGTLAFDLPAGWLVSRYGER